MQNELLKRTISSLFLIPIAIFFILIGSFFFASFLFIIFFVTAFEWLNLNKKLNLIKILGILFLSFSLYLVYLFRVDFGFINFLLIISICVFTDIGGYLFGKTFKGPKLTKISPNKTYAGVVGSFLISSLSAIIYLYYIHQNELFLNSFINENIKTININFLSFSIIIIISLISQIGDLIISYFKRKANVKDTGKILPGHGGLLDRIDGMILVFPISYLIFSIILVQ